MGTLGRWVLRIVSALGAWLLTVLVGAALVEIAVGVESRDVYMPWIALLALWVGYQAFKAVQQRDVGDDEVEG